MRQSEIRKNLTIFYGCHFAQCRILISSSFWKTKTKNFNPDPCFFNLVKLGTSSVGKLLKLINSLPLCSMSYLDFLKFLENQDKEFQPGPCFFNLVKLRTSSVGKLLKLINSNTRASCNLFKVNNKDIRMMSLTSFFCLYC